MKQSTIIFFLLIIIVILLAVILYQRVTFQKGMEQKLREISLKLAAILETGSDEQVMVFTDRKVLMELAAQLNLLLEDRSRMKSDYRRSELSSKKMLSNISHDIKTPLTVILGYLEIMRLDRQDDEMLLKVEKKAKQVMDMINQFFTLAKLEAGDTDIELSRININEVCRESILDFYELLSQKHVTVDISIPETAIFVQGNKESLHRILFNLLSNAVRYGLDGNYLGLSLRTDDHHAYVSVTDKGKGIDPESALHVFDRLYTMEDSRSRQIQGNGLGLTIAKNLAMQMNGDLILESVPGQKTTFTLQLNRIVY